MIVLSVGMPRAGSGWHYNFIHDLMQATGCEEASAIRTRFHLESILTEVNCNIGTLSPRRMALVALPALLGNTFVIKAHAGPTAAWRLCTRTGLLRTAYIYRDPRDAMLSAMEYGRRTLSRGRPNSFSKLINFEQALDFILVYIRIWERWVQEPAVLISRYEDFLRDYPAEASRIVNHLRLDPSRPAVRQVISHYHPHKVEGRRGTHFFKGRIGRFRDVFSRAQQAILAQRLGAVLERMGYTA